VALKIFNGIFNAHVLKFKKNIEEKD